jgi:biotin carboxyl carrier protein
VKYVVEVAGRTVEADVDGDRIRVDGSEVIAHLTELPGTPIAILTIGDTVHQIAVTREASRGRYVLSVGGRRYEAEALDERTRAIRQLSAANAAPSGPAPLVAPMPGLIVRVNVAVGDVVRAGQGLVVMEAMKMENELRAAAAGVVKAVRATPGTAVERGTTLVELG